MKGTAISMVVGACLSVVLLPAGAQNPPGLDFSKVGIYAVDYDFLDFTNYKFRPTDNAEGYAQRVHAAAQRGQYVMMGLYTWDRVWHKKPLEETLADTDVILDAVNLDEVDMIFLSEEEVDWSGGFDYLNAIYDHVKKRYDGPVYQWYSMPMVPRCDQKADGWIFDAYGYDYDRFRKHLMKFIVIGKPVVACINGTPGVNSLACSKDQVRVCEEFNIPMFFFSVHGPGSVNMWRSTDDPEPARWRSWFFRVVEKCHATDTSTLPAESAQHSFADAVEIAGDGGGTFTFHDDFATRGFIDQATIHGFLNLEWSSGERAVWLKAGDEAARAELIYHLTTPFGLRDPSATIEGEGELDVALSANGETWTDAVSEGTMRPHGATASLNDTGARQNLWVRVRLRRRADAQQMTMLRNLKVTGTFLPPESKAYQLSGKLPYEDDFEAQRYLHIGEIESERDLAWKPGQLSTRGVEGRGVRVEVKQHFVSDKALDLARIVLDCSANAALGGHNELALSLDGETEVASVSTAGKESGENRRFRGALELDLTGEAAKGVTDFWVRMVMINSSGKETGRSNALNKLTVEGQRAAE